MSGPSLPLITVPQAQALGFSGGLFLGIYLISAVYANRWLIFTDDGWKVRENIHWGILITTNITLVCVIMTQGMGLATYTGLATYVEQGHQINEYVALPWIPIVKCACEGIIVLLADTVLMYRLWITHMRRMAFMWLPIILWFGSIACLIMELFLQIKHVHDPNFGPYQWANVNMNVGPGIVFIPFLGSNIILNAYCTGLLMWRVWKSVNDIGCSSPRQLQNLVRILMESGILYLSMSIAHFISYFGHDNFAIHVNGAIHGVVVGIAFDLIIIRVGQNRTEVESSMTSGNLTAFRFADMNHGNFGKSVGSIVMDDGTETLGGKFVASGEEKSFKG